MACEKCGRTGLCATCCCVSPDHRNERLAECGTCGHATGKGRVVALEKAYDTHKRLERERDAAVKRAETAHRKMRAAQAEWEEAVMIADALGVGATRIARAVSLSETAIRLFIKRRKKKGGA